MSFLGRDEHNFSEEKVLMRSLSTPSSIHHHDDQNHGLNHGNHAMLVCVNGYFTVYAIYQLKNECLS
jgi:hypothetical protein